MERKTFHRFLPVLLFALVLHQSGEVGQAAEAWQLDQSGGVASTHIVVRVVPGVAPIQLPRGRWSFQVVDEAAYEAASGGAIAQQGIVQDTAAVTLLLDAWQTQSIVPALSVTPADTELAAALGLDRYYRVNVPHGTFTPDFAAAIGAVPSLIEVAEVDGIGTIAGEPNDPFFFLQYGLLNIGQTISGQVGVPGADVSALEAWTITTGSATTVIAVLDAGVGNHVDLQGRLLPGWNVVDNNDDTGDNCLSHGTHVTGIIAANANNGIGITGIDWHASILPVVILGSCNGLETQAADGVIWATDNGADIINMSVQYSLGSQLFHNAIQYGYNAGARIFAAAGNHNVSGGVAFPGRWDETVAVAATNNQDEQWSNSNTGPQLNVAAPGQSVYSLTSLSSTGFMSGTSMATPLVAGTAGLMLALDPTLTHDEIREILEVTAVDLPPAGFNHLTGHGRIDAYAALLEVQRRLGIPGDLNGDGVVDVFDLLILLSAWGPCENPDACPADLDMNGTVDVFDLMILLGHWG